MAVRLVPASLRSLPVMVGEGRPSTSLSAACAALDHVLSAFSRVQPPQDVDARDKPEHDGWWVASSVIPYPKQGRKTERPTLLTSRRCTAPLTRTLTPSDRLTAS